MQEDADMGEAGVVDAVAKVGQDFHLSWVAVGLEDAGGGDGGVGGEDVVVRAVEEEDWLFIVAGREAGRDREGAAAGDEACGLVGEGGEGVENGHSALGEAEEGDIVAGDAVSLHDVADEGIQLGCCGLEAGFVAEGPAGVPEPLVALAERRGGWRVRAVDGQSFPELTERELEGGGEGDEVVARGTKTV